MVQCKRLLEILGKLCADWVITAQTLLISLLLEFINYCSVWFG